MSDTWSSIQAHKKQLDSLRERLRRRRKQDPLGGGDPRHELSLATPPRTGSPAPSGPAPPGPAPGGVASLGPAPCGDPAPSGAGPGEQPEPEPDPALERRLLLHLSDLALPLPTHAGAICRCVPSPQGDAAVSLRAVESLLHKFAAQELIEVRRGLLQDGPTLVTCADHAKLSAMTGLVAAEKRRVSQEILELLNTTTAKEQSIVEKFRSRGRAQVQEFCDHGTKEECVKASGAERPCRRLHFRRIINKHTDESLGDCSFLNTCFHMDTCKYVHYEIDACAATPPRSPARARPRPRSPPPPELPRAPPPDAGADRLFPPQWICCDIRYLDVSILGKFAVVMADPPWDIHMELPYGTLTDDEMRRLNIPVLQDEGFLFLWVTGRAMELGRECLNLWGYERVDEIIWVKTNQLQRIIRTGRTGHWLNHGKEHCLVGVKGNPQGFNRGLDCDVIVAEVRSTSHKPDEIYGMIERLSPGTRKIELFGRPHNVQPNWFK
ncbi:PREDICTED: N6-adenosine-methyltransferase 70 kDa subunit [Pseudopodoces humilis]|uniref:N6-adenosine-methyltransferase 70 kDa subunit n=1 Tax=Pseudopodoces humilis TaxID=181119 RepID=UPI0006B8551D|nr:PREDICTED: N6-adenosine-methyltransferase 70 kDa subunit [Pseudopodoces humilis]